MKCDGCGLIIELRKKNVSFDHKCIKYFESRQEFKSYKSWKNNFILSCYFSSAYLFPEDKRRAFQKVLFSALLMILWTAYLFFLSYFIAIKFAYQSWFWSWGSLVWYRWLIYFDFFIFASKKSFQLLPLIFSTKC